MNDDRRIFVGNLVVNCSLSNSNALRPLSLSCHAHRILAHSHQYLSHAAHVHCQCEKRFKTSPHLSAMLNAHLLLTMWVSHTLDQTITSISYKRPASTSLIRNCQGQSSPVLCALRGLSLVTQTFLFEIWWPLTWLATTWLEDLEFPRYILCGCSSVTVKRTIATGSGQWEEVGIQNMKGLPDYFTTSWAASRE